MPIDALHEKVVRPLSRWPHNPSLWLSPSVHDIENDCQHRLPQSGVMSETSDCIVFSDAAIKRGDHIIWQHGTFAIPTGSVTAIVGTNGTGKTTMMRPSWAFCRSVMAA